MGRHDADFGKISLVSPENTVAGFGRQRANTLCEKEFSFLLLGTEKRTA